VRGHYRFKVKEWGDGSPWLAAEPTGDIIPGTGDLGFDLDPGATLEQAHALAPVCSVSAVDALISRRNRAKTHSDCLRSGNR
jgi:hypothetical protein